MIFVDPLFSWAPPPAASATPGAERYFGNGKESCHMFSFGAPVAELHVFALKIGLKRSWFQSPPKSSLPHYDLTPNKRRLAVKHGAVDLTRDEDAELLAFARTLRKFSGVLALVGLEKAAVAAATSVLCPFCGNGAAKHAVDLRSANGQGRVLCDGRRVLPTKM